MCPQNSRFEMGTVFILKLHQAQTWVVDYINFSYLGVTCMSTAVDTHTHTPPAPPAHQEFRVKAIYIARVPPASMGDEGYPQDIHIGDLEADPGAVQAQLLFVAQHHTARTREFAAAVCRAVGGLYCECDGEPEPLEPHSNRDKRMAAARDHPGTCGVAMAAVIAAVETEDVEETANRRQQQATLKTFRNQACFDAARALNARGRGFRSVATNVSRRPARRFGLGTRRSTTILRLASRLII
ncbi:unnamed protein product [Pylaiella littoralis]